MSSEKMLTDTQKLNSSADENAWMSLILAWLIPGLGHFYLRRFGRGAVLGAVVWALFGLGIVTGGHLYGLFDSSSGFLSYIFGFFDLGSGLLYFVSRVLGVASVEQAQVSTAEYGNVLFMLSGLLNYLLALDAYDLASGRK